MLLGAGSGVLLALGLPPLDLSILAWIGLVPLLLALKESPGEAFRSGFVAGFAFNGGALYWLALNSGTHWGAASASMLATVSILATAWGFASRVHVWLTERWGGWALVVLPFAWTTWEGWLGHLGEIAFPWPFLALTQNGFDAILQVMEFTGSAGVTFWVAAVNGAIFAVWQEARLAVRRLGFGLLVMLALIPVAAQWHAYNHYRSGLPLVRVAVIQGNIAPDDKWRLGGDHSLAIYDSLTTIATLKGVDLALWPETAVPDNLLYQSYASEKVLAIADRTGAAIVTGASDYVRDAGRAKPLNASFLVLPQQGIIERGAKKQLVPMGERVPFQWIVPALGDLNLGQAEFLPAPRPTLFSAPVGHSVVRFPTLVCFESAFPGMTADFVRRGANFLTTISNDAWYGRSSEPAQISVLSRFRAIETRRAMARASNCGYSFLCDQLGRVIAETELYRTEWRVAALPLCDDITFYVRHGEVWLKISALIYGLFMIGAGIRTWRRKVSVIVTTLFLVSGTSVRGAEVESIVCKSPEQKVGRITLMSDLRSIPYESGSGAGSVSGHSDAQQRTFALQRLATADSDTTARRQPDGLGNLSLRRSLIITLSTGLVIWSLYTFRGR